MIIQELQEGVLSQTTTLVKNLILASGHLRHTNKIKVSRIDSYRSNHPQIKNSVTQLEDNVLTKSMEISYLTRKYQVQDIFVYTLFDNHLPEKQAQRLFISSSEEEDSPQQTPAHDNPNNKKLCLFVKKHEGKLTNKRDTKNIPKNFCKAFYNYMQNNKIKQEDPNNWDQAMKNFAKLQAHSNYKYNNMIVQKLLSNQRIAPYFKKFLQGEAEQWIHGSRITDKQSHIEAIKIYMRLLDKLSYAEQEQNSDQ